MTDQGFPDHWGWKFTERIHTKPEGPTDPTNNKLHSNFVVLVTGAGKGVGFGIAISYAKAGAKGIIISSRTQSNLDQLEAQLKSINPGIEVLSQICDTTKDSDVEDLAKATKERFGRLDAAIANAGIISKYITNPTDNKEYMPVGIVSDPDLPRVIDTNVLGTWRVARAFVPLLQTTTDGPQAFAAITSAASHMTDSQFTPIAYILSKIAINRMMECIRNDHEGIGAFAVHPGTVLTPQTERHHETQLGEVWTDLLTDDPALCGGFLTWLTKEKRPWLSGRYISSNWDVEELHAKKGQIVEKDLLTFRMQV
ncbi:hypothetical protein PRZ48_013469 [Zasmidium cellare]|uniref:NAD(P)-binding protein n=1 Tax=Zasmidium cellare TaxID=395010 RepID=A0ABR0E139_ZASCE|nr:hypothetical protein PRZ48_013469 [Zasmidium cellare]